MLAEEGKLGARESNYQFNLSFSTIRNQVFKRIPKRNKTFFSWYEKKEKVLLQLWKFCTLTHTIHRWGEPRTKPTSKAMKSSQFEREAIHQLVQIIPLTFFDQFWLLSGSLLPGHTAMFKVSIQSKSTNFT